MQQRINVDDLIKNNSAEDVVGRYISLKKDGAHLRGTCPFHQDHEASLVVTPSKNLIRCFACGWSEDIMGFVMKYTGKSFRDACAEIDSRSISSSADGIQVNTVTKSENRIIWTQVLPAPANPPFDHYKNGKPSRVWAYFTPEGYIHGYVCRFDMPDGTKEVLPYTWATDGKTTSWRWQGFDRPRPLYNLHLIARNPEATILLVEGEKSADAAQAQFNPEKVVVTTWPGGAMAISHIDWSAIHGRRVMMWGDNDVQGLSAMLHVAHLNAGKFVKSRIIPLNTTSPKGWDCADYEWQQNEMKEFILEHIVDEIPPNYGKMWRMSQVDRAANYEFGPDDAGRWTFRELPAEKIVQPLPPPDEPVGGTITVSPLIPPDNESVFPENSDEPEDVEAYEATGAGDHFKFLGWDRADGALRHHFFQLKTKSTMAFTPAQMSKSGLISLAPLTFWESMFPGGGKAGSISIEGAQEFLIRRSETKGPFNERNIRGRGAWTDKGRVVVHTGRDLIVNGKPTRLGHIDSTYIYETSDDLGIETDSPMDKAEAHKLIRLIELLNWDRDVNVQLLAGWCVIATFCGALKWRPHIWLTGSAGTGKSWVFDMIVRRLLGRAVIAVQGETSEAGLRQTLNHDALPVVFDEMDSDGRRSAERIQNVLTLARSASTDDGGILLKGSTSGVAKSFSIRSCFAFASIGIQASQQSDRSRITILSMKSLDDKKLKDERWNQLQELYAATITDDYVGRLQARTVQMLPVILKNAATFSAAGAAVLGAQRTGDQLGAMLAGAYSLYSDKEVSFEFAVDWVKKRDWAEEKSLDATKDEKALLSYLLDHIIVMEGDKGRVERTVGEIALLSAGQNKNDEHLGTDWGNDRLKRFGIKAEQMGDDWFLIFSNSSSAIKKILNDTAWNKNHARILMRVTDAREVESARFAGGARTRAVAIPFKSIFN